MKENVAITGFAIESGQKKPGPKLAPQKIISSSNFDFKYDYHEVSEFNVSNNPIKISKHEVYKLGFQKLLRNYYSNLFLINIGGDHSIALSTVSAFKTIHPNGVVIWIDAHGDMNIPSSSPTGSLHGMPVSTLLKFKNCLIKNFEWTNGFQLKPDEILYIGVRDLDPYEKLQFTINSIKNISAELFNTLSPGSISKYILSFVKNRPLHISFDVDSLDPDFAPSTGVKVENGISPIKMSLILNSIINDLDLKSLDIVELNPLIGSEVQYQKTLDSTLLSLEPIFIRISSNLISYAHKNNFKKQRYLKEKESQLCF